MSELPGRVRRAFADHTAFEQVDDATFESATTTFDGTVEADEVDGHIRFTVEVRVPLLNSVTEDEVAAVVEDGWFETFELRVEDIGGVFRTERDLDPTVTRQGETITVEASFEDINEQRGVDDAGAIIDYVEGTFVQGIIPGYEYTEPVASIIDRARENAGGN
ncbi:MAG: DUF5813 family protein [Euryarchaeota archaeon]|nr:DUF5813 family protein [Euryarchaeota archaeon]